MKTLISLLCAAFLFAASATAFALPVNINKADAEMIADALSGIGQKTAEKIVEYRSANGPFTAVDELLKVQGIGEKKLDKIRQDIQLK